MVASFSGLSSKVGRAVKRLLPQPEATDSPTAAAWNDNALGIGEDSVGGAGMAVLGFAGRLGAGSAYWWTGCSHHPARDSVSLTAIAWSRK